MSTRRWLAFSMILLAVLAFSFGAFSQAGAVGPYAPTLGDTTTSAGAPATNYNAAPVMQFSFSSADGTPGNCVRVNYIWYQFDLEVDPARTVGDLAGSNLAILIGNSTASFSAQLYSVPGGWDEATFNHATYPANDPASWTLLDTKPAPTTGGTLTFQSTALATYLATQENAGQDAAFMLAVDCSSIGALAGARQTPAETGAQLSLLSTNAVSLVDFKAGGMASFALLALGVVLLVSAVLLLRRRTTH